jgi:quercetin dioxygenase-like cupin family protein
MLDPTEEQVNANKVKGKRPWEEWSKAPDPVSDFSGDLDRARRWPREQLFLLGLSASLSEPSSQIFRVKEDSMATAPTPQLAGQDPVKVDPKHYKVEFENDRVRVLRISYGPHEKSAMHAHPPVVAVFLTDGHFKFTYPDGRTEEIHMKAGEILPFEDASVHLPENLSGNSFEAVGVELKR